LSLSKLIFVQHEGICHHDALKNIMDALADAAEAAAAASYEEASMEEEMKKNEDQSVSNENDEDASPIETSFHDAGFAITHHQNLAKLMQVRKCCSAMDLCSVPGVPLVDHIRCAVCGYSSHFSCQKTLEPPLEGLRYNRVCKYCIRSKGLASSSITDTRCHSISSLDDDLTKAVAAGLHLLPLQFVSRKEFDKLHQDHQDGLNEKYDSDDSDDSSKLIKVFRNQDAQNLTILPIFLSQNTTAAPKQK
jgi:hypothetical protein